LDRVRRPRRRHRPPGRGRRGAGKRGGGPRMTRLVVVSAGLSVPSSTRLLADRLTAAVTEALGEVEVVQVELRDHAHQLTDRLLTGFAAPELAEAMDQVREADGLVVVTPVFSASYSG